MNNPGYIFQYRSLAEALHQALAEDAFYIAMEASVPGSPAHRREAMLRYYDFSIREGHRYGEVVASDTPAVGASIWTRPVDAEADQRRTEAKHAFLRLHMGIASLETYDRITGSMARQTGSVLRPGSWYLSIIGVSPAFQGRGLGGGLVRPMLERTDQMGVSTYLETFTARNMPFYSRLGYEPVAVFDEPGAKARYWVMVRRPPAP